MNTVRPLCGHRTWRQFLLGIERELVLAGSWYGMIAGDLPEYLFARSTGHFTSLMSMISRGCYRTVKTGSESLTAGLLDQVRIDQAACLWGQRRCRSCRLVARDRVGRAPRSFPAVP